MMLSPGQVLQGRYRIVELLGQGGMGAVYRAWDTRLRMPVAIKEMTPQDNLDPGTLAQLRQQFEQEAITLARLKHNHLVGVTDFFEERGNAYLVMEFVEGQSLGERIQEQQALPEDQVLAWARQLLGALAYCHDQGIVHRDVKPQNVVIRPDGQAVLVDFGLVKLWDPDDPHTRTAIRSMGTPEYAPPEQYDAAPGHTDARSDLYSLGATLYHALTGTAPPTATQRMADPTSLAAPRTLQPSLSPRIERAILKAMEPQPPRRFQSAREMARALRGERTVSVQRQPPPRPRQTKVLPAAPAAVPWTMRVPTWVGPVAALAVLVVITAVALQAERPARPSRPAATAAVAPATHTPRPRAGFGAAGTGSRASYVHFTSNRDGKREIYRLTPTGTVRVTHTPAAGESWEPALAPDGTLYFVSNRDGKREIYRLGAARSVRVTHTPRPGESWAPQLAPDGTLYFVSDRDGKQEVYRLSPTGSVRVTHTQGPGESWAPALAPDGTPYFVSDRDGKQEVYRLGPAGSVRVTHTFGGGESWEPALTADGTLYFVSNRDGKREIYRLDGQAGVVRVTHTPANESWEPAG